MAEAPPKLIINSPYEEPQQYLDYDRETQRFITKSGRRPAGYVVATQDSQLFDDPGYFEPIDLVNKIRPRVGKWREGGYAGITSTTKRLLNHWSDPKERRDRRFFFCQLEAIETLIWLCEAPASDRAGINIEQENFERWCSKMATGTGKTIVMAMIIAWNVLNKVTSPQDTRFSRHVLVVAPGITVKNRLEVLKPSASGNYYEEFGIVPFGLMDRLRQGQVLIHNWHVLDWESQAKINENVHKGRYRSVDRRRRIELSDDAYTRQVLDSMAGAQNIIVINDEAHHAWRVNPADAGKNSRRRLANEDSNEATVWVGGLDRIHRHRGILRCFDLSATPFAPSGKKSDEASLFKWIVSDFGLNDAIEAGLVKTPRVVIRDDSIRDPQLRSRLYHLYADKDVSSDINRKAESSAPLPPLLVNAYNLLGSDWLETKREWERVGHPVPPVMISVANRTETAARIKHSFDTRGISVTELCDPEKTLHIDSKTLKKIDSEADPSKTEELIRKQVQTVGVPGEPGERFQHVISVAMLSEGWDAKTVTHIMGLRAFTSQLLCEQVVGRGLRRISYDIGEDGLFQPEYVNIFGVPFSFLPHEGGDNAPAKPPKPKTKVEVLANKKDYEIQWPNIQRIETVYSPVISANMHTIKPCIINAYEVITKAELKGIVAGKPSDAVKTLINIEQITEETRIQTIIFQIASKIYNAEKGSHEALKEFRGNKASFLAQIIPIVEAFINSNKLSLCDEQNISLVTEDPFERKVHILLNMNTIVNHILAELRLSNENENYALVFDTERPILSTEDMRTWYTSKPCERSEKSHISHCVYDSTWEASEAFVLEHSAGVAAYARNDHLDFWVYYMYNGAIHKYYPDFLLRLANGHLLVLETKGQESEKDRVKREALELWVRGVNAQGEFGNWHSAVSYNPSDLQAIIHRHSES